MDSNKDFPAHPLPGNGRPKIGLALGAGVARGWAHIGVLRGLEEQGIRPDIVAGTSIGAVVGGALVAGGLDSVETWARGLSKTNFFRYLDFRLLGGGLFGGKKLLDLMAKNFGDGNIEDLDRPFAAVATDLRTGHEVWLQSGRLVKNIQASFALPGVFDPVDVDGRWLVDGALTNPVPVSVCRALGAEIVIAVNLNEDLFGRARAQRIGNAGTGKYGVFHEDLSPQKIGAGKRTLLRNLLKHESGAPSIFANMVASLNILQNRLARSRLAGDPPDVTIQPRCGHIGLMEFHRADELIDLGYKAFQDEHEYIIDALDIIGYPRHMHEPLPNKE